MKIKNVRVGEGTRKGGQIPHLGKKDVLCPAENC